MWGRPPTASVTKTLASFPLFHALVAHHRLLPCVRPWAERTASRSIHPHDTLNITAVLKMRNLGLLRWVQGLTGWRWQARVQIHACQPDFETTCM